MLRKPKEAVSVPEISLVDVYEMYFRGSISKNAAFPERSRAKLKHMVLKVTLAAQKAFGGEVK